MTDATRNAPISRHPAFKWGVGVWFALLMGLGLFVMPTAIHQSLAERLAIDGFLTGTAARIALSFAAALLGLLIGIVLAMRVAAINDAVSEDDEDQDTDSDKVWLPEEEDTLPPTTAENSPRRPFNPREHIEEEGISGFDTNAAKSGLIADSPPRHTASALGPDDALETVPDENVAIREESAPQASADLANASGTLVDEREKHVGSTSSFVAVSNDMMTEAVPSARDGASIETAQFSANRPIMNVALGDLSLDALTARLERALKAQRSEAVAEPEDTDPVVTFLRREAERGTQRQRPQDTTANPQADLRSALDRLNRVSRPK